jgi:hypothetical protein
MNISVFGDDFICENAQLLDQKPQPKIVANITHMNILKCS